MQRILLSSIFMLLFFSKIFGQASPSDKPTADSASLDKHITDSLLKNDDFFKIMNDDDWDKPTSYFKAYIGIGNQLYSGGDKALQSLQNNNQLILSPALGYYDKSGLGITFTGYLFNANNNTKFYQYTLSPSYEYLKGKVIDFSVGYTHYFEKDIYKVHTSPIQNDFYTTAKLKKLWLEPGIAGGYSEGKSNEIVDIDTTIKDLNQKINVKYTDTVHILLRSVSLAATVEHEFDFSNLFSKNDGVTFIPQLSLISGINKYTITHQSSLAYYNAFTKKKVKRIRNFLSRTGNNNKYDLQSLGADFYANYTTGKFFVEPELYFDYYLPKTTDIRMTEVFNVNVGITF